MTSNQRDWRDECRVERSLEAPPSLGLASTLHIYCHTGTHVDSAFQDDPSGKGLWEMSVDDFCAYTVCLDCSFVGEGKDLTAEKLGRARGVDRLEKGDWIFLTSRHPPYRGPRLTRDGGEWLIEKGVRGIGRSRAVGEEHICHKLFHNRDMVIIDSLDQDALLSVAGNRMWTVAFPLAVKYLESSPCRVVAFEE